MHLTLVLAYPEAVFHGRGDVMENTSYLLIGGGLASYQAAKQLRQLDAQATITLVSEEDHLPYDRPPLTKEFLRGEKPRDQVFNETDNA